MVIYISKQVKPKSAKRWELRAVQAMSGGLNEGIVVDTAKLMMHRPIVRRL
jgi:hypothetical protein